MIIGNIKIYTQNCCVRACVCMVSDERSPETEAKLSNLANAVYIILHYTNTCYQKWVGDGQIFKCGEYLSGLDNKVSRAPYLFHMNE